MEKVKIPASHLRAGNLHLSQKLSIPILQMFSVEIDRVSFSSITAYGISLVETGIIDFNPIPLSDVWLERFGFIKEENGDWFIEGLRLSFIDKEFLFDSKCSKLKEIKWLHQLQNLYFAHTEQDLKLK